MLLLKQESAQAFIASGSLVSNVHLQVFHCFQKQQHYLALVSVETAAHSAGAISYRTGFYIHLRIDSIQILIFKTLDNAGDL
jgi:catechol-2,3-dioxygenase